MATFKNFKELERHLQRKIESALKTEVAETAVKTMKEKVQEEVYDAYPNPVEYERTGRLKSDIDVEVVNSDTIAIQNVRQDDDRYVAEIVESGQGYEYSFEYSGVPRPFTEETRQELLETDKLKQSMREGLKRQGVDSQ